MKDVTGSFLLYDKISISCIHTNCLPERGIYFWWSNEAGMRQLDIPLTQNIFYINVDNVRYYLCYIGIGPKDSKSRETLPKRITKSHLGNKIKDSTFRYAIASKLNFQFYKKLKKYCIIEEDENTITKFLKENFTLSIIADNKPWLYEAYHIEQYAPPLNWMHNTKGWHFESLDKSRDKARRNSL